MFSPASVRLLIGWFGFQRISTKTWKEDGSWPRKDLVNFWCVPDKGTDPGISPTFFNIARSFNSLRGNNAWIFIYFI